MMEIINKPLFIPSKCPKCGKVIDGLEINLPIEQAYVEFNNDIEK